MNESEKEKDLKNETNTNNENDSLPIVESDEDSLNKDNKDEIAEKPEDDADCEIDTPKKKKRVWLIVLISVLALILLFAAAVGIYMWRTYSEMKEDIPFEDRGEEYSRPAEPEGIVPVESGEVPEDSYETDENGNLIYDNIKGDEYTEPEGTATPIYRVPQKDPNIINVLLLGRDSRNVTYDRGRTDTMLLVSYNKATKQINMISFMRDCLVPISGYGWTRLNHAYAYGGVGLTINTINELFDLDIQNYITVDFTGIEEIINKIGGVDVYLTQAEVDYYKLTNLSQNFVPNAVNHMNGYQARHHMQNRSVNGDGDFSRTRRQRDVMNAMLKKVTSSETSVKELTDLISFCTTKVATNMPFTTMLSLGTDALTASSSITTTSNSVPFTGTWHYAQYNGMSVLRFDIDACAAEINRIIYEN